MNQLNQNIDAIINMANTRKNPQQIMQMLIQQNPQVKQMMTQIQNMANGSGVLAGFNIDAESCIVMNSNNEIINKNFFNKKIPEFSFRDFLILILLIKVLSEI